MIIMRCIVVGDSMPMPSFELNYEDTYLFKLKSYFKSVEFIDRCRRASSVRRLVSEGINSSGYDLLEMYNPDFVILNLGATDASPRLLPREALYTRIINTMPFAKGIYNIVRRVKGRTISCNDVSPEKFYSCLSKYVERAKNHNVIVYCVKIAYFGSKVLKKNPLANKSFDLYNKLYDKLAYEYDNVRLVTPLQFTDFIEYDKKLQSDYIHLTADASTEVFENIKAAILKDFDFN